ncbi:MAG: type II toxin-antitoxin system VapC family toxin [Thermosynechococcaceae cyanobacterium]
MGMNYLLDTHVLLWWIFDDPKLNTDCRNIISDSDHYIFISSASAWEIATKYRIGKLPEAKPIIENYVQLMHQARFIELGITTSHALRAGSLPIAHRDPFDRILMAQSELEQLPIITYDQAFHTGLIQVIPSFKVKP